MGGRGGRRFKEGQRVWVVFDVKKPNGELVRPLYISTLWSRKFSIKLAVKQTIYGGSTYNYSYEVAITNKWETIQRSWSYSHYVWWWESPPNNPGLITTSFITNKEDRFLDFYSQSPNSEIS